MGKNKERKNKKWTKAKVKKEGDKITLDGTEAATRTTTGVIATPVV